MDLSWFVTYHGELIKLKVYCTQSLSSMVQKQKNQVVILHDLCVHMARPLRSLA